MFSKNLKARTVKFTISVKNYAELRSEVKMLAVVKILLLDVEGILYTPCARRMYAGSVRRNYTLIKLCKYSVCIRRTHIHAVYTPYIHTLYKAHIHRI